MRRWNYLFEVPDERKVRMIVHTDCKNEADDQFALAHHVMTPKFLVKGIVAGHFEGNPQEYGSGNTAKASEAEVHKVLKLMDVDDMFDVYRGTEYPLSDESHPNISEGAKFIVEEAMRDDPHPLFIACQGAITDLACAILMEPRICERMTAIWIGGGQYPVGGFEFNCQQDPVAVNVVMKSTMPVWQVPSNVYKQMSVTLAELQEQVRPYGAIGRYLFEQMVEFNRTHVTNERWPHGEIWGLGDSPTIGVLLEEKGKTDIYDMIQAPTVDPETLEYSFETKNREIRVYNHVNARTTLSDFFAKLHINYGPEMTGGNRYE